MTGPASNCSGCASSQRRFRSSRPKLWCTRFHQVAEVRCIDYRTKPDAIKVALDFIKRTAIK